MAKQKPQAKKAPEKKGVLNKIKPILFLLALLAVVLYFTQCSPQKRLNRLVQNNPELVKTDTTMQERAVTVPGFSIDTITPASHDIGALIAVIDSFSDRMDTMALRTLKTEVTNHIYNRNCLDAPVKIPLPGGGYFQMHQAGGKFFYHIEQPPRNYKITVPLVTMRVETVTRYAWNMFLYGVLAGWVVLMALGLFLKFKLA